MYTEAVLGVLIRAAVTGQTIETGLPGAERYG